MTSKVIKYLKKSCPECGHFGLEVVLISDEKNGVVFESQYEQCEECGYSKKINNKHQTHQGLSLNPKWD